MIQLALVADLAKKSPPVGIRSPESGHFAGDLSAVRRGPTPNGTEAPAADAFVQCVRPENVGHARAPVHFVIYFPHLVYRAGITFVTRCCSAVIIRRNEWVVLFVGFCDALRSRGCPFGVGQAARSMGGW